MSGALLALPVGLAIGLLLGLVGGGSILAVPVLVYLLGEPVKDATTESLLALARQRLSVPPTTPGSAAWRYERG